MARSDRLRLKDARAVYRLIGDCRELGHDAPAWRSHMLDGLRRLVDAQVALYMHIHEVGTASERISSPQDAGFLDAAGRTLWGHYQRHKAYRDDPFHLRCYSDFTGSLRTCTLEAVVEPDEWRRSRHYNDYVRACRLGDRITSSFRLPEQPPPAIQVIVLHQSDADSGFSRRAQRLVHLFHHELSSLLGRQLVMPEDAGREPASLPPRLRQVLDALLQGEGEKQIAFRLGISRHTVNRHVQRLYRRFGVQSRGELMFRCRDVRPPLPAAGIDDGAVDAPTR